MTDQTPILSATPLHKAAKVGDLMSPPIGVFTRDMTVAETVEKLRELTQAAVITYCYVVDAEGKLEGVVVMRDMLLAAPETKLEEIMLTDVFWLRETMPLADALKAALNKHFPVYPVADENGVLKGLVRGEELFAEQAIEISAQAGQMVGVEKEERLATPLGRSLRLRHPWLQINLLTAFVAAAVVGIFEDTLARLVILAVFLPVMAGTDRQYRLPGAGGDAARHDAGRIEARPGRPAGRQGRHARPVQRRPGRRSPPGVGMAFYATQQGEAQPWLMGFVVFFAMAVSCTVAGIAGRAHPADPEAARRRPGDRVEHLPHHRQRRRLDGRVPDPGDGAADLVRRDGHGFRAIHPSGWKRGDGQQRGREEILARADRRPAHGSPQPRHPHRLQERRPPGRQGIAGSGRGAAQRRLTYFSKVTFNAWMRSTT